VIRDEDDEEDDNQKDNVCEDIDDEANDSFEVVSRSRQDGDVESDSEVRTWS